MPDTTAKIRAKGLAETGFTEEHAEEAYTHLGGYTMAIVELRHEARVNNADGGKQAQLTITQLSPVPIRGGDLLDDHLRELAKTLHYNAALASGDQPHLEGTAEPAKLGDVIEQGAVFRRPSDAEGDED